MPGSRLSFELGSSAADGVDEGAADPESRYGFRCTVTGFTAQDRGLGQQLELELVHLVSRCALLLMAPVELGEVEQDLSVPAEPLLWSVEFKGPNALISEDQRFNKRSNGYNQAVCVTHQPLAPDSEGVRRATVKLTEHGVQNWAGSLSVGLVSERVANPSNLGSMPGISIAGSSVTDMSTKATSPEAEWGGGGGGGLFGGGSSIGSLGVGLDTLRTGDEVGGTAFEEMFGAVLCS